MKLPAVEVLHEGRWRQFTSEEVARVVQRTQPSSAPIEAHVAAWLAFLDGHTVNGVRRPGGAMPRPEGAA